MLWFVLSGGLDRLGDWWFGFGGWLGFLFLLFGFGLLFLFLLWLFSEAHDDKEIVLFDTDLAEDISVGGALTFEYNFLLVDIQSLFFLDYLFQIKDLCF